MQKTEINRKKLSSGLDLVVISKNTVPIVSLNLAYKVGSKDEVPGKTGFAHLFEHLMFEGTSNIPKGEFDKTCSLAGGTNNAYTTYDWTAYTMTLPSHQLELGFWLESDRLFNFKIMKHALTNQQKVVTEEIKQTVENQPYGRWREKLAEAAYSPECFYSHEVHGKIEDVQACSLEDARQFFHRYYNPHNVCMAVCGNISFEKAVELGEKYFGDGNNNHDLSEIKREIKFSPKWLNSQKNISFEDKVPFNAVFLSFHFNGFYSDDVITAEIFSNIAGNGRSSTLYNALVYEKQIASQVGAYVDKREFTSLLTFYAIANHPETSCAQLYNALNSEIKKMKKIGVSPEEMEKSKNSAATQFAYELQQFSGIADVASFNTIFFDEPERTFSYLDKYLKITKKDVDDFMNHILTPKNSIRVDVVKE